MQFKNFLYETLFTVKKIYKIEEKMTLEELKNEFIKLVDFISIDFISIEGGLIDFEDFFKFANSRYKELNTSITIVFKDGSWIERHGDWDNQWVHKKIPVKPLVVIDSPLIGTSHSNSFSWMIIPPTEEEVFKEKAFQNKRKKEERQSIRNFRKKSGRTYW